MNDLEKLLHDLIESGQIELPEPDYDYQPDPHNAHVRSQIYPDWKEPPPPPPPPPSRTVKPKRPDPLSASLRRVARKHKLSERALRMAYNDYRYELDSWRAIRGRNCIPHAKRIRHNIYRQLKRAGKVEAQGWRQHRWFDDDHAAFAGMLRLGQQYYLHHGRLPGVSVWPSGRVGGPFVELCRGFLVAVDHDRQLGDKAMRQLVGRVRQCVKQMVGNRA